eukprot:scaffold60268_cov27-Tisochrysis_lutea.AAC.1
MRNRPAKPKRADAANVKARRRASTALIRALGRPCWEAAWIRSRAFGHMSPRLILSARFNSPTAPAAGSAWPRLALTPPTR